LYSDNFNASKTLQSIPKLYCLEKSDAMSVIMDREIMGLTGVTRSGIDIRLEQN
jgi:hypothetical protein